LEEYQSLESGICDFEKSPVSIIFPICFELNRGENGKYSTIANQRNKIKVYKLV
jgi:hypothetical protein